AGAGARLRRPLHLGRGVRGGRGSGGAVRRGPRHAAARLAAPARGPQGRHRRAAPRRRRARGADGGGRRLHGLRHGTLLLVPRRGRHPRPPHRLHRATHVETRQRLPFSLFPSHFSLFTFPFSLLTSHFSLQPGSSASVTISWKTVSPVRSIRRTYGWHSRHRCPKTTCAWSSATVCAPAASAAAFSSANVRPKQ